VDFQSRSYSLLLIQYLSQRFGFHLKGSYTDTDDYRLRGLSFSLFQEF